MTVSQLITCTMVTGMLFFLSSLSPLFLFILVHANARLNKSYVCVGGVHGALCNWCMKSESLQTTGHAHQPLILSIAHGETVNGGVSGLIDERCDALTYAREKTLFVTRFSSLFLVTCGCGASHLAFSSLSTLLDPCSSVREAPFTSRKQQFIHSWMVDSRDSLMIEWAASQEDE